MVYLPVNCLPFWPPLVTVPDIGTTCVRRETSCALAALVPPTSSRPHETMAAETARRILDKMVLPYEVWLTQEGFPRLAGSGNRSDGFRTPASIGVAVVYRR